MRTASVVRGLVPRRTRRCKPQIDPKVVAHDSKVERLWACYRTIARRTLTVVNIPQKRLFLELSNLNSNIVLN